MKQVLIIENQILIVMALEQAFFECGYGSSDIAETQDEAIQFSETSFLTSFQPLKI